ncbi:MAG: zinc ABC transporter substrate-binding protein [Clostridia bacterium]|nr:zinc ABC transporter substrate-binding protein [Clostridia bacterium]
MRVKIRKVFILLMIALMTTSGCGNGKSDLTKVSTAQMNKKVNIVTSFYPMYIFTKNITKDIPDVSVTNMTEPQTGCLHDYQLSPADIKILEKAQIFVVNGAGMESFMEKVTGRMSNLKILEASKGIEFIREEHEENKDEKKEGIEAGTTEEGINPHVWVGISGAIKEVMNIGEQLSKLDPEHAEEYKRNTDAYVKKLEAQKEKMHLALKDIKNKNIVTFHEAFPYFAKEFNLNIVDVVEREPGTEPSAGELSETIKKIKELNVKALFAEPQYPAKSADTIARETGAKVYTLDPVVTGPKEGDTEAYIKAMDQNLQTLIDALK